MSKLFSIKSQFYFSLKINNDSTFLNNPFGIGGLRKLVNYNYLAPPAVGLMDKHKQAVP